MDIIHFLHQAGLLKRIKRSGWELIGIDGESVADHSYRTALIAYFLSKREHLDEKQIHGAVLLALLHDLHETRTLDHNMLTKRYVKSNENKARDDSFAGFPELRRLFYDRKILRIVEDADVLELAFQAKEYLDAGNRYAKSWLKNAAKRLKTPSARKLYRELGKQHSYRWVIEGKK